MLKQYRIKVGETESKKKGKSRKEKENQTSRRLGKKIKTSVGE